MLLDHLVRQRKSQEQLEQLRTWKIIEYLPTAFGRSEPIRASEVFPLLKEFERDSVDDDDDDVDPRQSFSSIAQVFHARQKRI